MTEDKATETAWRIHAAIVDWTGKVDSKASFALAIESALLAGIVTLSGSGRRLSHLSGAWEHGFFWVGVAALIAAVVAAVFVVRPRLRSKHLKAEAPDNFIFFGHLNHWDPSDLARELPKRDVLPVLSRQLVRMSEIAWEKHIAMQWSVLLAFTGALLVGLAAALAG